MPLLVLNFDISALASAMQNLAENAEEHMTSAIEKLAVQTHAHIIERANKELAGSSRLSTFVKTLEFNDTNDELSIVVPKKSLWIEDGLPANFDMLDGLLKNSKKVGPKGKYAVIPFKHNKSPQDQSALQSFLTSAIKKDLKKNNIPYKPIEKNPDGSPKYGLLHKMNTPVASNMHLTKKNAIGPVGHPTSIHSAQKGTEGPSGRPYLFGVKIYQKMANNKEKTSKDIMTFRTASESQRGQKWIHPGLRAMGFLDEAALWADKEWSEKILPEIKKELGL